MSQRKASPATGSTPKRKGAGASGAAAEAPPQQSRQPSPPRAGSPPKGDDAPGQRLQPTPISASFSPLSKDFWRSTHEMLMEGVLLTFLMRKIARSSITRAAPFLVPSARACLRATAADGWENTKPAMPMFAQNAADWAAPKLGWASMVLHDAGPCIPPRARVLSDAVCCALTNARWAGTGSCVLGVCGLQSACSTGC
jgi:hypothetical protein